MNTETLMPKQALCALLELIINKALSLDNNITVHLDTVNNKSITLLLAELGFPLTLQISAHKVLVMANTLSSDCTIQTNLKTLPKLKQAELLTPLIKAGELDIIGDPKIAQQFANIAEQLDIDWQSQLADRIGDVSAYKLTQLAKLTQQKVSFAASQISQDASEFILHEKNLIVSESQINKFNQQVADISQQVDTLSKRLSTLITTNTKDH